MDKVTFHLSSPRSGGDTRIPPGNSFENSSLTVFGSSCSLAMTSSSEPRSCCAVISRFVLFTTASFRSSLSSPRFSRSLPASAAEIAFEY